VQTTNQNLERLVIEWKDDENIGHLRYAIRNAARITNSSFGFQRETIADRLGSPIAWAWFAAKGEKLKWRTFESPRRFS
jgi:hypothetical protein